MMSMIDKRVRAVVGLMGMAVVVAVVFGYLADYKQAAVRRPARASSATTETAGSGTATSAPTAQTATRVVVMIEGLNFRPRPDAMSRPIAGLKKGDRLALMDTLESGWFKVKDAKGVEGYVSSNPTYTTLE